jgi:hypothetical protein
MVFRCCVFSVVASRRVWPAQHVVPTVHNVQVSATELVTGRVGREQDDANDAVDASGDNGRAES